LDAPQELGGVQVIAKLGVGLFCAHDVALIWPGP